MKLTFSENQIELLQKIPFDFDISGDLTDDQILEIDERVDDYFAHHGITDDDDVNEVGVVCESIIDLISDLPE
jgi:hypothetical protein